MKYAETTLTFNPATPEDIETTKQWPGDTDVFLYSGDISPNLDKTLRNIFEEKHHHKKVFLHLTTFGGDPDAAFKVARLLRRIYEHFTLCITADCKSAGTLLALGAHEIVMADSGELGPLDVQLFRPDEFLQRSSGLSISQALKSLSTQAFEIWEEMFLSIRARSGGVITTKTASEIAKDIAVGLFAPMTEKIDPARVGEMQRSMEIAVEYGKRLGANEALVHHLAADYPSHSFVIDFIEAQGLFPNLRAPNLFEDIMISHAAAALKQEYGVNPLSTPVEGGFATRIIVEIEKTSQQHKKSSNESNNSNHKPETNSFKGDELGDAATKSPSRKRRTSQAKSRSAAI